LQLFSQPVLQVVSPRFALCQSNALVAKKLIEFLDLSVVSSFGLRQMGAELLDLRLVASFCLRKDLAVQTLDLRNPFWNERI
jgi:hypothetical protein